MKRTKIICTIGPASEDQKTLAKMIESGMNVARLNFSHGSYENHAAIMENIRQVSAKTKTPVAILQDLQGPKIRVSKLENPVEIKKGQKVVIGKDFGMDFDISGSVKAGEHILIEDGLIDLLVEKVQLATEGPSQRGLIHCTVIAPGPGLVQSHKGINMPNSTITFPILTDKDIRDLKFGLQSDVDYVALSFVRDAEDIIAIKKLIKKYTPKDKEEPRVIAKIELAAALEHFDEILEQTDAVMVARGDLGVEIPDAQVPVVQKSLIAKCLKAAKPVIVATQMLDSMIRSPRPTRAEVSDVANAVIDQADAVMLSGESAFGSFPIEAVSEMNRIIEVTEESYYSHNPFIDQRKEESLDRASIIAEAVTKLADGIKAKAIIGTTETGFTARYISQYRPHHAIIMLTDRPKVHRQLCLFWGVRPLYLNSLSALKNVEGLLKHFVTETKRLKLVSKDDKVVLVAGNPLGERMNLVQALTVN